MELMSYKHWPFQTELEILYWMPVDYWMKEIQLQPSSTFLTHCLRGFSHSPVVEILLFMTSIIDSLDSPLSSLDIAPDHWFLFENRLNPSCSLNVNVFHKDISHPLFFTKTLPRKCCSHFSFPPLTWDFYFQFKSVFLGPRDISVCCGPSLFRNDSCLHPVPHLSLFANLFLPLRFLSISRAPPTPCDVTLKLQVILIFPTTHPPPPAFFI